MPHLDFANTSIAFQMHTDSTLRRARLLFRSISSNHLVKFGNQFINLMLRIGFPVAWFIKPTIYRQFVGGESIAECQQTIAVLSRYNVNSILDYSVEGKESEAEMEAALAETLHSVENASKHPHVPFSVFKPTAFIPHSVLNKMANGKIPEGNDAVHVENFKRRVTLLCEAASRSGKPILIDAEESWYQWFIDQVTEEMMQRFNKQKAIVFNTLQMYRHDRLAFLKEQHQKAVAGGYHLGVKFVRGAYMEKERERAATLGYPSPIQPDKESTDHDFDSALTYCLENLGQIAVFCGTHNEKSCNHLVDLMMQHNVAPNDHRIWFSQLYGMSDHISFNMAHAGFNVAKYVPYGPVKHVIPYLARRAEENTSVKGQTGRELSLISLEISRRNQLKNR